jgi:hypothetical protein
LRVPPAAAPSTTGATERASRTIANAIPPNSITHAISTTISDVLVPEVDSCVLVVVVGVLTTCEGGFAAPVAGLAALVAAFPPRRGLEAGPPVAAPRAGFTAALAAGGDACEAAANGLPASLAAAAAVGSASASASAAHAHAAIGDVLTGMDVRIELAFLPRVYRLRGARVCVCALVTAAPRRP